MDSELQERFAKIFPTQAKSEEVLIFTRKHWFLFFVVFLILFLMLVVPIIILAILIRFNPDFFTGSLINIIVILTSMYILFICGAFLIGFINLYFDVMILTNKRIIDINQKGLFNREINELDLLHVEDVRSNVSGFFSTLLDYGSIEVQTAGTARNFIFNGLPHPRQLTQKILENYKKALEIEQFEDAKTLDMAEGLGGRTKHLNYDDIHGFRPSQTISALPEKPSEIVGPEEEAKIVEDSKPVEKKLFEEFKPNIPKSSENSFNVSSGSLEEGKFVNFGSVEDNMQVLIKFNLPKNNEEEVLKFLPSLKSPTVNDLADKNFIAIETVVKKTDIDNVLQKLKDNNASGIIQTDIRVL